MKTRTLLILSALAWCGGAAYSGYGALAVGLGFAHMLIWHLHKIEVKLNRLLDQQNLYVSEAEMSE